jgi:type IV pilus assembly protein PilN
MLKEVKNVEEERKKVSEKIEIIERLKKNQAGPVLLLDVVSTALPKSVDISSLSESNNNVNIDGEAFTNEDIVRFIDNLKASPLLKGVMLLETSQSTQDKIDIYKYKLQFVYKGL